MTRECKGIIGFTSLTAVLMTISGLIFNFTSVSLLIPALLVFIFMVGREVWQYKTKQAEKFEYEDVVEYGIFIGLTSAVYLLIVKMIISLL